MKKEIVKELDEWKFHSEKWKHLEYFASTRIFELTSQLSSRLIQYSTMNISNNSYENLQKMDMNLLGGPENKLLQAQKYSLMNNNPELKYMVNHLNNDSSMTTEKAEDFFSSISGELKSVLNKFLVSR